MEDLREITGTKMLSITDRTLYLWTGGKDKNGKTRTVSVKKRKI
jgi:hypothetical protein